MKISLICQEFTKRNMERMQRFVRSTVPEIRAVILATGKTICGRLVQFGKMIVEKREALGYYAVLGLVLVALSAGAHDYRSRKTEEQLLGNATFVDPGIAVQMQPDPTMVPASDNESFVMPVQGAIIGEFKDRELVWSTTMQLWQTHPAVDIAANVGEAVVAAADGKVVEAFSDALYGNVIVIDHGNGCTIRYASLNTLNLVKVGQNVKMGDIISAVGTCAFETELGAHVHLECFVNQEPTDFMNFLTENDS